MTLKSPPSMMLELQGARLPLSKPFAKMRSLVPAVALAVGVYVSVAVDEAVAVQVGVRDGPVSVNVAVAVAELVGVKVKVGVLVCVAVMTGVPVRVGVGVRVAFPLGALVLVGVGEGPRVAVRVGSGGLSTAFSAAAASTMPLPHREGVQLLPAGKARAELCKIWRLWVKLSVGSSDTISDRTPAMCGAAMLVPW